MIRRMSPHRGHPQLTVERAEQDGVQVVELRGELDLNTAAELDAALADASAGTHPHVCLDLSRLKFIDSTGLAAVIRSHVATGEAGGALMIVATAGSIVRRTLEMSGLMEMLSVADDRATALADLA
jgi:anti-anti-sigma factor